MTDLEIWTPPKFFMVYCRNGKPSGLRYAELEGALKEARKRARKEKGRELYIVEAIGCVKAPFTKAETAKFRAKRLAKDQG